MIVTGGLGPTSDDLTRESISEVLGLEMVEDELALRTLLAFFEKRGLTMAETNRKQAMVPVGADVLPNPNGTAPGLYLPPRLSGGRNCAVFLLPGPPSELYPMVQAEVMPRLKALSGLEVIPSMREMRFVGVGESDFHQGVDEQLEAIEGLEVGYCARLGEVDLRLVGSEEVIAVGREIALAHFADKLVSRRRSDLGGGSGEDVGGAGEDGGDGGKLHWWTDRKPDHRCARIVGGVSFRLGDLRE